MWKLIRQRYKYSVSEIPEKNKNDVHKFNWFVNEIPQYNNALQLIIIRILLTKMTCKFHVYGYTYNLGWDL